METSEAKKMSSSQKMSELKKKTHEAMKQQLQQMAPKRRRTRR
jgi:hypothetical protein